MAGGRNNIPRDQRLCRFCDTGEVESARHFVCSCARFEDLRKECLRRVLHAVADQDAPILRAAVARRDLALFCGDTPVRGLPAAVARQVDTVLCGYLKLLGRERRRLWKDHCSEGSEWVLR